MADVRVTEPTASKVVNIQIAWGSDYEVPLDDVFETLKRNLTAGVGVLAPAKRVTVMDQYWLIDGERVTPTMLADREKKEARGGAALTAHEAVPDADILPVDPRGKRVDPREQPRPTGG